MIHISNLSIGYRQHGGDRLVASGIEANIEGGRLTCLIGANGAGKSTLLKRWRHSSPNSAAAYI